MPSIASHFACASLLSTKLPVKKDDFFLGNILPDIIANSNSHKKIRGSYYMIPDIDFFERSLNLNDSKDLGYLSHLLLDRYFLEEYIPNNFKKYREIDAFSKDMIYNDYTIINSRLLKKFNLDLSYLNKILNSCKDNIDDQKLGKNKLCINSPYIDEDLKCLDENSYIEFLLSVSYRIVKEIENLRNRSEYER